MTNYKNMKQALSTMQDVRTMIVPLATELKERMELEERTINGNDTLSDIGRTKAKESARDRRGRYFIEEAKKLRNTFDEAAVKAEVASELVLNERPRKPSEVSMNTFKRKLHDFKLDLLTTISVPSAFDQLEQYIVELDDPYFARVILDEEFAEIAEQITALSTDNEKAKTRSDLRKYIHRLREQATTHEQVEAVKIHETAKAEFGAKLFQEGTTVFNALTDSVGGQYTRYANRPQDYVAIGS